MPITYTKVNLSHNGLVLKPLLILSLILSTCFASLSQDTVNQDKNLHLNGNLSANYNGISLIPSFSLGRPAWIFEFAMGGDRLGFEPEMRFAIDGKPWSFIFWGRYKIHKSEKFNLHVGAHPGFMFFTSFIQDINGQEYESTEVRRFLAGEIVPSYKLTTNFKIGAYYLAGKRVDKGFNELNQFLALNADIANISLSKGLFLNLRPQVFYLKTTLPDGYYASTSALVAMKNFPLGITGLINRSIKTEIIGDEWIWNVGLVYRFTNDFIKSNTPL